jgi:hypothetical protein
VWSAPESPAGAAAFGVRVPAFRVGVAPFLLVCPALVLALSLDLLPDQRVVLCPDFAQGVLVGPVVAGRVFASLGDLAGPTQHGDVLADRTPQTWTNSP